MVTEHTLEPSTITSNKITIQCRGDHFNSTIYQAGPQVTRGPSLLTAATCTLSADKVPDSVQIVFDITEPQLAQLPQSPPKGRITYDRKTLLKIGSTSPTHLMRPLRKTMFRLTIWGQHHGCSFTSCKPMGPHPLPS